ncbi:HPr family phosphocarrier protein [Pontiella sulfatireligans]|uniref:Phosphocarrier protein HPr n=1 Tax=Pontiella sulfatireligans TaxID=2750658 RepID=A0A6C2UNG7_9BACT|nr:HPr family phosphocarrier protein [Pontiella sulfatireligans]VGO21483.1 Phosphocarrier protein HPr [Pontiella sulfatireligans]
MFKATAVVKNEAGIHCRPSAILVREGCAYEGEILITAKSGTCTLTSALGLIMLGLEQGAQVSIQVTGSGEDEFGPKLVELFETHFDFPPQ